MKSCMFFLAVGTVAAAPVLAQDSAATSTEDSTASAPAERERILVLDLSTSSVDNEVADVLEGSMATALSDRPDLEIVTSSDLSQVLELEAQREAIGCDDASCLQEVAGALGARYVIYGRLAKLDSLFVLQISLFDADRARPVGRSEMQSEKLSELATSVKLEVLRLAAPLGEGVEPPAAATKENSDGATDEPDGATATGEAQEGGFPVGWVFTGVGVVPVVFGAIAAAAGGGVLLIANSLFESEEAKADAGVRFSARNLGYLGLVCVGMGVVGILIGLGISAGGTVWAVSE